MPSYQTVDGSVYDLDGFTEFFVIRATHERGVGVPSSRSLATATREAIATLRSDAV